MKYFNINEPVNVRLTEAGLRILENRRNDLLKQYSDKPAIRKILDELTASKVDENGYSSFSLWELMDIFGSYMYDGNPEVPFETIIGISDEYLVEQTNEKGR